MPVKTNVRLLLDLLKCIFYIFCLKPSNFCELVSLHNHIKLGFTTQPLTFGHKSPRVSLANSTELWWQIYPGYWRHFYILLYVHVHAGTTRIHVMGSRILVILLISLHQIFVSTFLRCLWQMSSNQNNNKKVVDFENLSFKFDFKIKKHH